MKKTILVIAFMFMLSFTAQAQLLQIGVKAGLNYANFSGTDIQTDAITSYHAGLIAEIKLLDKFAIQPELLYSTQGATYNTALGDFTNELGYISIPVLAKIYVSKSFSIELGPQASFLLSERDDFAKGILTGALIGGLVGVAVGLLIAPKSGAETREEIAGKARDFAEKVQDEYDAVYDKAKRTQDNLIHRLQEIEETARKKADALAAKLKS